MRSARKLRRWTFGARRPTVYLAKVGVLAFALVSGAATGTAPASAYDTSTLAGKIASVRGTAGLQIRFSAFVEQEAGEDLASGPSSSNPITPPFVLSSPLDGSSVAPPDVTVNQDSNAGPQNETAIAVDPNNPRRVVIGANDYATRTWSCEVGSTPCSALGDGYSGTYYSNDGGSTWCCASADPSSTGTLIPGVEHLTGGPYDAGGDPAVAFDSRGIAYYAGLGLNRSSPPNTVAVNRGTFDSRGALSWRAPTFINPTTSPSVLSDKEWIGADDHTASPFRDRVYVSFTKFIFNPRNGDYVKSPIYLVSSKDGADTFTAPASITGNVIYDQGSRVVVGADGTVYVFFAGSTRLAALNSVYVVKSTDGGANWSRPVQISPLQDISPIANAAFRTNSFPAADVAPNGDLYVAWSSLMSDSGGLCPTNTHVGCHATAVYSTSRDGGTSWSAPVPVASALDSRTQTAIGYPVTQPDGTTLDAPAPRRIDTLFPSVAISPSGVVYMSAYAADVVSPWQRCASAPPPPVGRVECDQLGSYIDNARLDYTVTDLTTGVARLVTTHPINTRNGFGGEFFGDYTDIAVGSDNAFHALWTDTNNRQSVTWFFGYQFVPTSINQQDVVTAAGNF